VKKLANIEKKIEIIEQHQEDIVSKGVFNESKLKKDNCLKR
jgi:hypothetical protein